MKISKYYPYRSSYERRYARWLEEHRLAGDIARWEYEPDTFELAHRTTYTPDFKIVRDDGVVEYIEVKGWSRSLSTSRAKWKIAAAQNPQFRWFWATWHGGKGCWKHEEYKRLEASA